MKQTEKEYEEKQSTKTNTKKLNLMNLQEKPDFCQETDCSNKAYKKNYLLKDRWNWVCKKHYYQFSYGLDYPRETVKYPHGKDNHISGMKRRG